jgi:hypothetical protein
VQQQDFAATHLPPNATNILSDEVNHWVKVNLVVYSSIMIRTVLQHCQHLVYRELSEYDHDAQDSREVVQLSCARSVGTPPCLDTSHYQCAHLQLFAKFLGPLVAVDLVSGTFPLADDHVCLVRCCLTYFLLFWLFTASVILFCQCYIRT